MIHQTTCDKLIKLFVFLIALEFATAVALLSSIPVRYLMAYNFMAYNVGSNFSYIRVIVQFISVNELEICNCLGWKQISYPCI